MPARNGGSALLNVLHFTNMSTRGGAEEHILTLFRRMDRTRFRLHLACPPEAAELLARDLPADVEVIPLCLRGPTEMGGALRLADVLRRRRIDVLHSHLFYSSLFASPVGRACGVPLIVETPHVRELWRRGRLKRSYVVDRLAARFVDRFIAVSKANARYLVEEKGLPAGKVVVVENGCDLRRFADSGAASTVRQELGLRGQDRVLLVVGRLEPQKGHRVLLDALPAVRAEFGSAIVVCVGEGGERAALEAQAVRLGVEGAVRFAGFRSDVQRWLAAADVVVLPSFYEGLPLAAIEALAASRPVVATAVDGTPEVIVDGQTGLTVPPGDAKGLAAAIARLLREPLLAHRLGQAGRRRVEERFDETRQVRMTEQLYSSAFETAKAS
jgi:glycosyltransferase involved in cell wall biosynthesis